MTQVNQTGAPIFEEFVYSFENEAEVGEALLLLTSHFGLSFVRTNATKHGTTELQLKEGSL